MTVKMVPDEEYFRADGIILCRPGQIINVVPSGMRKLSKSERDELRAGLCRYREYEGIPILDYTKN